jgi:hypothetical protein
LHRRAKAFQRLVQARATAVIGNVVSEDDEHKFLGVDGRR